MGSTRSNSSFFGNSLGVMSSSSSQVTSCFNPQTENRNELRQVFLAAGDGLLSGSNLSCSLTSSSNNLSQLIMQTSGKQNKHLVPNGVEHSLTRDFLGMAGEPGPAFLPHELAKFASVGSAMGLSQFTSNQ
ncbi:hypothetical protein L1049_008686 [Liquidambar formosana]|uniref:Uncharacterized protein n=1 Tax=Liquidambar formosana TaxID=63359 RepID=A0AAP0X4R7_LIQFO